MGRPRKNKIDSDVVITTDQVVDQVATSDLKDGDRKLVAPIHMKEKAFNPFIYEAKRNMKKLKTLTKMETLFLSMIDQKIDFDFQVNLKKIKDGNSIVEFVLTSVVDSFKPYIKNKSIVDVTVVQNLEAKVANNTIALEIAVTVSKDRGPLYLKKKIKTKSL